MPKAVADISAPMLLPKAANGSTGAAALAAHPPVRFLIATLIACIVVPLVVLAYSAWVLDRDLRTQAEHQIEGELDVMTQHSLKVFQTAALVQDTIRLLTTGLSDAQIRAQEPALHADFAALARGLSSLQSVWLIDRDGKPLISNLISPPPALDLSGRDYFTALLSNDVGTYIGPVLTPKMGGDPFFPFARRRLSPDGKFNGVITASLLPTDFQRFYRQLDQDRRHLYMMVRQDGAIIARHPDGAKPRAFLDRKTSPLLNATMRNPAGGMYTAVSSVDGIERLIGYRPIPGYPVFVASGVETASINAAWRGTLASHLAVGLPAFLLLVIALGVTIRRTQSLHREAQRRQSAETALNRTQRLEAIGELTGGVAHDFNNLLMIIRSSAERMRDRAVDPRDNRSLDIIERTVQRGAGLTRQLLSFARRQALAIELIDLSQHLGKFAEVLRRSLREDIELAIDVPPGPCMVKVDPGELELGLLNIAVNARYAMPAGGRIVIRVRPIQLSGQPETNNLHGPFVAISVTDTGGGIPADVMARVFEPFFTTRPAGTGTGLGLSQVYGFTRQSGGTTTLSSEIGRGTTVTLYLPTSHEAPRSALLRRSAQRAAGGGRRILLVEDTSDMAEVTRGLLQDLGYDVELAPTAREALERLDRGERFHTVISDIIMPGEMKGIDLARELRRRDPGLVVVLMTGCGTSSERASQEGFSLLQKPFDIEKLRELIDTAGASDLPKERRPFDVAAA